jgi:cellulose synthase/poly-beta-1,6-N-acetylglucosamine synthase-like glycosyltransferase
MLEPFSDPEVALTWTQETTKPEYPLISKYCVNEVNRAQAIGMGHTAVKRTAVQMSGGFLGLPAGEDIDLIKRLVKNGYKIICVDQPVYHNHAISFKQYWNKYKRNLQFTPIENYNHLKFIKYAIIPPKFDKTLFLHPLITFLKCAAIYETSEPLKLLSIGLAIVLFLIIFIVFPINNAILLYVILSSAIFFLWWFICY